MHAHSVSSWPGISRLLWARAQTLALRWNTSAHAANPPANSREVNKMYDLLRVTVMALGKQGQAIPYWRYTLDLTSVSCTGHCGCRDAAAGNILDVSGDE